MVGPRTIENARRSLPHLVDCAKRGRTLTYGELGRRINKHHRPLPLALGYIRDEICRPRGLPLLNVIVVNQDSDVPGESFLPHGGTMSLTERRRQAQEHQGQVFAYQGWDALLQELGLRPVE
jgi:hypothetical protein